MFGKCVIAGACCGRPSIVEARACRDGTSPNPSCCGVDDSCAEGHFGELCNECKPGYYHSLLSGNRCAECRDFISSILLYIFMCTVATLYIVYIVGDNLTGAEKIVRQGGGNALSHNCH